MMRRRQTGRHLDWIATLAGAALALCGGVAAAQADPAGRPRPILVAERLNEPIYDPATKSYFELRDNNVTGNWPDARRLAAGLIFKGAQGRLAIVRSQATHDFLRRNFNVDKEIWIGLRYWCSFRKLQWVDGEVHTRAGFNPWAGQWYRNEETMCGRGTATGPAAFMPVYYTKDGFRWQASGPAKQFSYYFVEYPTGAE